MAVVLTPAVDRLVAELARLPGIGREPRPGNAATPVSADYNEWLDCGVMLHGNPYQSKVPRCGAYAPKECRREVISAHNAHPAVTAQAAASMEPS